MPARFGNVVASDFPSRRWRRIAQVDFISTLRFVSFRSSHHLLVIYLYLLTAVSSVSVPDQYLPSYTSHITLARSEMPASVASSDDEDVGTLIVDIDQLQAHGINQSDIAKLKLNQYYTVSVCAARYAKG